MNFFDIDASGSDAEQEEVIHVEETAESQINPFWFGVSEDEDDEEHHEVLSGQEKRNKMIQEFCDTFIYEADNDSWIEADKLFIKLLSNAESYKKQFGTTPPGFVDCLRTSAENYEDVRNKDKGGFANKKVFTSMKHVMTLLDEALVFYKEDIEREENGGEDEVNAAGPADDVMEEEEGEKTEADYIASIAETVSSKSKKARAFQRIANACKQKGFVAVQISALGLAAKAILDEDNRLAFVSLSTWKSAFEYACKCYDLITANPRIYLAEDLTTPLSSKRAAVVGGLFGLLRQLYVDLLHLSQFSNGSKAEYLEIPRCENDLAGLTDAVLGYYQAHNHRHGTATCCKLLLALLGPRRQEAHNILFSKMGYTRTIVTESIMDTVKALARAMVPICDDESNMRAVCFVGYQYGLAGQYREGRDYLLRSGVQNLFDPEEQDRYEELSVLYNRALAQLGLAAFLAGDIAETYRLLGSLWSLDNHEVLIGQSMPFRYRTEEEELKYRDLLFPPHLRIPQAHLELAAMLAALVVDSSKEARNPYEKTRHQRYFFQAISRRNQLMGKPTLVPDQIAAAYHSLKNGNYQEAKEVVVSMSGWESLPNAGDVLEMYLEHLKETALRIFCFSNRCNFSTFSVAQLALKYELEEQKVRDIINQIISENNTLIAYWDRSDEFLYVDRNNTTHLQHVVLQTADSASALAPYTERRVRVNDGRGRGRGGRGGRGGNRGGGSRGGGGGGRG